MASDIFRAIFKQKASAFRQLFVETSGEVFYDENTGVIRHNGEYGAYRERILKDFLLQIIPPRLDVSTGFVITAQNDVSTQCDVVLYDKSLTPLRDAINNFFPVETVFSIGEVKSRISKSELKTALLKLSKNKCLGEKILSPKFETCGAGSTFNPKANPWDLPSSFLICSEFAFKTPDSNAFDDLYDSDVPACHKHNMVLSLTDGVLLYRTADGRQYSVPNIGDDAYTNCWIPAKDDDPYFHFEIFAHFLFMMTSQKHLLYPEWVDYLDLNRYDL